VGKVFHQISTGHPFRNELEGGDGNTQEGDDIRVHQTFPHHSCLVVPLWDLSAAATDGESSGVDDTLHSAPADLPRSTSARV